MVTIMLLLILSLQAADSSAYVSGMNDSTGWVEVDRKVIDGMEIVVRHKEVLGTNCLEGAGIAAVSVNTLLKLATDIPNQPGWSSWDVPVSERLGGTDSRFDYFQVLDNPSPVADRYWVLRAERALVDGVGTFRWHHIDPAGTPGLTERVASTWPDAVMTRINVGDWTFAAVTGGTSIRYRICTDAGGAIPRWVGEFAARTTLPTNLGDIVREAKKRGG